MTCRVISRKYDYCAVIFKTSVTPLNERTKPANNVIVKIAYIHYGYYTLQYKSHRSFISPAVNRVKKFFPQATIFITGLMKGKLLPIPDDLNQFFKRLTEHNYLESICNTIFDEYDTIDEKVWKAWEYDTTHLNRDW